MKVLLVDNARGDGDWEGLYIDGELQTEDHRLDAKEVLEYIQQKGDVIESVSERSFTQGEMVEMGESFPALEEELVGGESNA